MSPEQVEQYLSLLPYWTFSLAFAGSFYKLTVWIGAHFKPEFRTRLSEWLQGKRESTWIENFCALFDTLFGTRHFSGKRLVRSSIASMLAVVTLYVLFAHVLGVLGRRTFDSMSVLQALAALFTINVVADYLSLIETRFLLEVFKHVRSFLGQALLLIADLIFTGAIAIALIVLSGKFLTGSVPRPIEVLALFSVYSIFFYSSFFTSAWVWVFCASSWFVRLFTRTGLGRMFDIENEPVKQIALVGAALCLAGGLALGPLIRDESGRGNAFDRMVCAWDLDSCFAAARASHMAGDLQPTRLFMEAACRDETNDGNCRERLKRYLGSREVTNALWKSSCDQGYARACRALGWSFRQGEGVPEDDAYAVTLFRKACDTGDVSGCYYLGFMYQTGQGIPEDDARAVTLFRKACDGGDASGCYNLGFMYQTGQGIPEDDAEAVAHYRTACDAGKAAACVNLGYSYDKGHGVPEDDVEAAALYRKACDAEEPVGCVNLGIMYDTREGVPEDDAQAVTLYRTACEAGNAAACGNLGFMYASGDGVLVDAAAATALYRKACDAGDAVACHILGIAFASTGEGGPADDAEALAIYRRGCGQDDAVACGNLALIYDTGRGVEENGVRATALYRKACDTGYAVACVKVGATDLSPEDEN